MNRLEWIHGKQGIDMRLYSALPRWKMRRFASESGKSKNRGFKPGAARRLVAKVVGVGGAKGGERTFNAADWFHENEEDQPRESSTLALAA